MTPDERAKFLQAECRGDDRLWQLVEDLVSPADETQEDLVTLQMEVPARGSRFPDLSGQRIANRYKVLALIGRGGFGSVYRAYDDLLERDIALKVLHFSLGVAEDQRLQKFLSEARTVAKLDHRHIVPIYDAGLEGPTLWLAMRLLQGRGLEEILRDQRRLDPSRLVELLSPIAQALDHAHDRKVVHRDVKPSNILIENFGSPEEHAWLVDFGIARRFTGESTGQERALAGTPSYMAPEQIVGRRVDGRADVFALGCVVWEALCGAPAFAGENFSEITYRIVHEQVSGFETLEQITSAETSAAVQQALAKSADDRFATATAFIDAMARSLDHAHRPSRRSVRSFARQLLRSSQRKVWNEQDVLVAEGLTKRYGFKTRALDGFDLQVPRGSIFAMLGRNGSGKTTAIRTALGLYRADRGRVAVFGRDPGRERRTIWSRVGYVPESMDAYDGMTAEGFFGLVRSFHDTWDRGVFFSLLARYELPLDTKLRNLSRGMKTKVSLIAALARRPEFLVLDDPTIGLDVVVLEEFFDTLREVCRREGTTALIASHNVDELQQIATHVAFLAEGRTSLQAPLDTLLDRCRAVELEFKGEPPDPATLPGLKDAKVSGTFVRGTVLDADADALSRLGGIPDASVRVRPMSLKEIFVSHMK